MPATAKADQRSSGSRFNLCTIADITVDCRRPNTISLLIPANLGRPKYSLGFPKHAMGGREWDRGFVPLERGSDAFPRNKRFGARCDPT